MNDTKLMMDDIIKQFGYGKPFTSKELFEFYRIHEADLNQNTFRWRIYALRKEGLLSSVKRGVYVLDHRKKYQPELSRSTKMQYNIINNRFPYIEMSV